MAYLPNDHDEAFARLSAQEFLIEVLYANLFSCMAPGLAPQFKEELRAIAQRSYGGPISVDTVHIEQVRWLRTRSAEIVDKLLAKITKREDDLRALAEKYSDHSPS